MARLYSWNAYESELTGSINDSALTFDVVSAAGLSAPCWLVIDPDSVSKREYVKVTNIAINTLTVAARGEEGSAAGGQAHNGGTKVRAVPVHQWLDEIYDDIIAGQNALTSHEGAADPHPVYLTNADAAALYVASAGDTMTGPLVLPADPTSALEASTKKYVDTSSPVGKVDMFAGGAAPTGWLLCDGASYPVATYPALHAVIGDTYGGDGGTNFNVPNLVDRSPIGAGAIAALGAAAGAATVDIDHAHTMPSHSHPGPSHTHTVDPPNTSTGAGGVHNHGGATGANSGGTRSIVGGSPNINEPHTHEIFNESSHDHDVNIASFASGASGTGNTGSVDPGDTNAGGGAQSVVHPVLGLNFIIKAL